MSKYSMIFCALPVILIAGCPEDDSEEQLENPQVALEQLCPINCDTIETCYGLQPGETLDECITQCIEWRTEDLDRMGDKCDSLLIDLLECQYNLPCDDYKHYHDTGQGIDDPCGELFHEFHVANDCMGGSV